MFDECMFAILLIATGLIATGKVPFSYFDVDV